MARITLKQIVCHRKKDVAGKDEPYIDLAGQTVWNDKMGKGDRTQVKTSQLFDDSILVELKEKNGNHFKTLGSWTVRDDPKTDTLVATSSGYHYTLNYEVS